MNPILKTNTIFNITEICGWVPIYNNLLSFSIQVPHGHGFQARIVQHNNVARDTMTINNQKPLKIHKLSSKFSMA